MTKKRIKRKWEWVHDQIKGLPDDKFENIEEKKDLLSRAKHIDKLLIKAYPYAPTTLVWENEYHNIEEQFSDLDSLHGYINDPDYCVGCEMVEHVSSTLDRPSCHSCRYFPLGKGCDEDNPDSLYGQFMNVFMDTTYND
jgi:hypothetical protein